MDLQRLRRRSSLLSRARLLNLEIQNALMAEATCCLRTDAVLPRPSLLEPVRLANPSERDHLLNEFAIRSFLASRSSGSPRTVEWYRETLMSVVRVTGKQPLDCSLDDLLRYFAATKSENRYRALKAFYRFAVGKDLIRNMDNPFVEYDVNLHPEGLRHPPRSGKKPKILSPDEMRKLLAATHGGRHFHRDRAILLLLYDTGPRACEVGSATFDAVDLGENSIRWVGKGDQRHSEKERKVFFGDTTRKALLSYMRDCDANRSANRNSLFLSEAGQPFHHRSLRDVLERLGDRSGVRRFGAHLLRHTFAVNMWNRTKDLPALMAALGHRDIETTFKYLAGLGIDMVGLQEKMRRSSAADLL